jgi:NAD(P)-dependent dehydrogenase (short-subunit alcohol dehydrogenase family)
VAFSAAGKRVLITGASSGVGAALARKLATDQAVVSLIARRRDRLAEVLADCGIAMLPRNWAGRTSPHQETSSTKRNAPRWSTGRRRTAGRRPA